MAFPQETAKTPSKLSAMKIEIRVGPDDLGDIQTAADGSINATVVITNTDGSTRTRHFDDATIRSHLSGPNKSALASAVDGVITQATSELI